MRISYFDLRLRLGPGLGFDLGMCLGLGYELVLDQDIGYVKLRHWLRCKT